MSIRAMEAAVRAAAPSHTAKLVMMILAFHHNGETGRCFPSYERIAEEGQMAKSTVIKAVKELVEAGLISKLKAKRAGTYSASNHYLLHFMQAGKLFTQRERHHGYGRRAGSGALPKQEASSSLRSEEVAKAKPKRKRSEKAKPRFRMKPDWKPTAKDMAFASAAGFDDNETVQMADSFRDYWIAQGKTAADWSAAFRRWTNNQLKFMEADNARARTRTGGRFPDRLDSLRSFDEAVRSGFDPFSERRALPGDGEGEP